MIDILIKKCVRSFIEVRHYLCLYLYLYLYMYTRSIQYYTIGAEGQFMPSWRGIEPEFEFKSGRYQHIKKVGGEKLE